MPVTKTKTAAATAGLVAFAEEVPQAKTPAEVLNLLDRLGGAHGVRGYAIWRVPLDAESIASYRQDVNLFVHPSTPKRYWDEFWPMIRMRGPSVLSRLAWLNNGLFTWTDASRLLKPTGDDQWIFDITRKHGLRDGVHAPVGRWIVGFWSAKVLNLSYTNRVILYAAAVFAVQHLEKILARRGRTEKQLRPVLPLTEREVAVLREYALGRDTKGVAAALKIDESTVKSHFSRIKQKLKATHLANAVYLAMRERRF